MIETAFGSGYVPYKCTSKNEINHYHLSLVGQNYQIKWQYNVGGQDKKMSIHSCYLIGEWNERIGKGIRYNRSENREEKRFCDIQYIQLNDDGFLRRSSLTFINIKFLDI